MHDPPLILVVDDTRADALLLSGVLSRAGYRVAVAHDGPSAARMADERRPALILLDMTMPGTDGIETCQVLKSRAELATIPVVFVTSHSDTEHIVKAFGVGGSDYVTKPIVVEELLARILVQLRLREGEQKLIERNDHLQSLTERLAQSNFELAQRSRLDGLTGLLNRRAWDEAAMIEVQRARRHRRPFSVLLLDVDWFKRFNDALGHPEGDRCLQQVAKALISTCRSSDVIGRYGGEEFVILAPETRGDEACRLAERVREGVWKLDVRHPASPLGRVTVSVGVAEDAGATLADLLRRADEQLYQAKHAGRNFVCGAPHAPSPSAPRKAIPHAEPPAADTRDGPCVLLVEDNRTSRMVYRGCLEKRGCRIVEVENGAEALTAVTRHHPDLILMDVMMPVMDGIECTRRLKGDAQTSDIPIIMISARNDPASVLAGLEAGAEEYLSKPIRTTELTARVRSMLRLRSERRDLLRSYQLRAEQVRFLTILVDLCRMLTGRDTVDAVFDTGLCAIAEVSGGSRAALLVPDAGRRQLVFERSLGLAGLEDLRLTIDDGPLGAVFAARDVTIIDELAPAIAGGCHAPLGPGPWLVAPLVVREETLGIVLVGGRPAERPLEAREREYVELLAAVLAPRLHLIERPAVVTSTRALAAGVCP
jgi:diguanylate cyclase (GGDEF)-like protein